MRQRLNARSGGRMRWISWWRPCASPPSRMQTGLRCVCVRVCACVCVCAHACVGVNLCVSVTHVCSRAPCIPLQRFTHPLPTAVSSQLAPTTHAQPPPAPPTPPPAPQVLRFLATHAFFSPSEAALRPQQQQPPPPEGSAKKKSKKQQGGLAVPEELALAAQVLQAGGAPLTAATRR